VYSGAQRERERTLLRVRRRTRITEDSEKLCQEGIERVQRVHRRNPELLNVLWKRHFSRRASRYCASRHRSEKNSLSSVSLREESTEGFSLGC
jgi:hypothetical protein